MRCWPRRHHACLPHGLALHAGAASAAGEQSGKWNGCTPGSLQVRQQRTVQAQDALAALGVCHRHGILLQQRQRGVGHGTAHASAGQSGPAGNMTSWEARETALRTLRPKVWTDCTAERHISVWCWIPGSCASKRAGGEAHLNFVACHLAGARRAPATAEKGRVVGRCATRARLGPSAGSFARQDTPAPR